MGGGDLQAVLKHKCKVCGKNFSCGRSLGGHMRSHLSLNSGSSPEADERPHNNTRSSILSNAGYGLRENPKKTWRLSEPPSDKLDKLCKECGKGFPTWKSLFGHMSCHSRCKLRGEEEEEEEDEEELEEMEIQEQVLQEDGLTEGLSDNEVMVPRKRRRSRRVASITCSSSSATSEFNKEQEDVALTLMMLSRDIVGFWSSVSSVAESSNGSSVISESKDELQKTKAHLSETNGFELSDEVSKKCSFKRKNLNCSEDQCKKGMISELDTNFVNDVSNGSSHKAPKKKSRYECTLCSKTFNSYQAFGGHRASHMRMMKSCAESRNDSAKNGDETSKKIGKGKLIDQVVCKNSGAETSLGSSKKVKEHECPVCFKIFSSGQALGGHKRSHLLSSSKSGQGGGGLDACQQTTVIQHRPPVVEMLDLNLPAPVNEDFAVHNGNILDAYWISIKSELEPLVGMISN